MRESATRPADAAQATRAAPAKPDRVPTGADVAAPALTRGPQCDLSRVPAHCTGRGGTPLEPGVRRAMEHQFGHDLSSVRVRTGAEGDHVARAAGAVGLTVGNDVWLGGGHAAASPHGRLILGHELAHVLQQRRGGERPRGDRASAHEADANRVALGIALGERVFVCASTGVGIARLTPEELEVLKKAAADQWRAEPSHKRGPGALGEGAYRGRLANRANVKDVNRASVDLNELVRGTPNAPHLDTTLRAGVSSVKVKGDPQPSGAVTKVNDYARDMRMLAAPEFDGQGKAAGRADSAANLLLDNRAKIEARGAWPDDLRTLDSRLPREQQVAKVLEFFRTKAKLVIPDDHVDAVRAKVIEKARANPAAFGLTDGPHLEDDLKKLASRIEGVGLKLASLKSINDDLHAGRPIGPVDEKVTMPPSAPAPRIVVPAEPGGVAAPRARPAGGADVAAYEQRGPWIAPRIPVGPPTAPDKPPAPRIPEPAGPPGGPAGGGGLRGIGRNVAGHAAMTGASIGLSLLESYVRGKMDDKQIRDGIVARMPAVEKQIVAASDGYAQLHAKPETNAIFAVIQVRYLRGRSFVPSPHGNPVRMSIAMVDSVAFTGFSPQDVSVAAHQTKSGDVLNDTFNERHELTFCVELWNRNRERAAAQDAYLAEQRVAKEKEKQGLDARLQKAAPAPRPSTSAGGEKLLPGPAHAKRAAPQRGSEMPEPAALPNPVNDVAAQGGAALLPGMSALSTDKQAEAWLGLDRNWANALVREGEQLRARTAGSNSPDDKERQAYFDRTRLFADVARRRMLEFDGVVGMSSNYGELLETANRKLTELRTHLGGT